MQHERQSSLVSEQKRKGRKKTDSNKPEAINKMAIRTYIWIITLNVKGLNAPNKSDTHTHTHSGMLLSSFKKE